MGNKEDQVLLGFFRVMMYGSMTVAVLAFGWFVLEVIAAF